MKVDLYKIIGFFLFFLPFTQALTIHIGFNLKISEVLLMLLVFYLFFVERHMFIEIRKMELFMILFLIWAVLSFFVNFSWDYDYKPKEFPYRINRIGDSMLRVFYLILCFLSYFLAKYFLSKKIELLDFWIYGAIVAAVYGWYLFVSSYLGIPYLKLPGMLDDPQLLYGIVRSGTFKEGNFFGMFLVLSAAVSFYRNKKKLGWFLLFSLLSTFSTISFISGLLFIIVYYFDQLLTKRKLKKLLQVLCLLLITAPFIISTTFFQSQVVGKLSDPIDVVTDRNFSSVDRSLTGRIAFNTGLDNPFFGVGPYNYGNHYDNYNDITLKVKNINIYLQNYFAKKNQRAIPNNVYLEVWAEYGIIGFLIYITFLIYIVLLSHRSKERALFAGCLALVLSMNAFPSFIMMFIWVFLAVPVAVTIHNKRLRNNVIK